MKIYTLTCNNAYNYGAVLQAYALQKYLTKLGNDVKIIDYYPPYLRKISEKYRNNYFLIIIRKILYFPDYHKSEKVFSKFKMNYLKITKRCDNKDDIINLDKPDLFVVGSDQVWNPYLENGKDDCYFLNFGKVNKISYAASISAYKLDDKYKKMFYSLLNDYISVTVREKNSVKLLKEIGINSQYVMDPVYLLSVDEWEEMCTDDYTDDYILVYALHHIQEIYDYAFKLAKKLNVKVYVISVEIKEIFRGNDKFFWNPEVTTYLSLFKNAKGVVSNSFHGVSFGLIFNKPVHIFDTEENDMRLKNIIDLFNISNRVNRINDYRILENVIDEQTKELLCYEIKRSKEILQDMLKKVSAYE